MSSEKCGEKPTSLETLDTRSPGLRLLPYEQERKIRLIIQVLETLTSFPPTAERNRRIILCLDDAIHQARQLIKELET